MPVIDLLPFLVGCVLWAAAAIQGAQSLYRLTCWQRTTGTVIGYWRKEGCYFPKIAYRVDDEPYTCNSSFGRGIWKYNKGDSIPVLYDPVHPDKADAGSVWALWLLPAAMLLIGTPFVIGSSYAFWQSILLGIG